MANRWSFVLLKRYCNNSQLVPVERPFRYKQPVAPLLHKSCSLLDQTLAVRFRSSSSKVKRPMKMLYDGECPICVAEINILKKFNKKNNAVEFYDITVGEYRPEENAGIEYKDAMGAMHVIGQDGQIYTKMDAVREMYKSVGLGFVASLTNIPGLNKLLDKGYDWFAINRYRLTGRDVDCETGRCRIKDKKPSS